ncbi:MAG: phospholipase [Chloroflexota bacterium]|nr:phospholipase [Chloroflexota bacterium]
MKLHAGDDGSAVFRQDSTGSQAGTPNPLPPFRIDTALTVPEHQGDCTNDVLHQWIDEHDMWNDGKMDRWVVRHVDTNGPKFAPTTMGFYDGTPTRDGTGEMDFYWALADNFTICDNYFSSVIGGTDINRLYSMTGTCDPDGYDGGLQFLDTQGGTVQNPGFDLGAGGRWIPYPEVLANHRDAAGAAAPISWKVYGFPDQVGPLTDNVLRFFPQYRPVGGNPQLAQKAFGGAFPVDFLVDAAAGTLPQVSWIIANAADSEHAPAPVLWGEDTTHIVVNALMSSPLWPKTALFLTYDENGGFFDHVPPPTPPPPPDFMAGGEYLDVSRLGTAAVTNAGTFASKPIGLGFRVPCLVISPFTRNPSPAGGPLVCSDQFDHTSLLKFVERVFGAEIPMRDPARRRPGLSPWRRDAANIGDLTTAFNFVAGATTGAVTLPATSHSDPRTLTECPPTVVTLGTGSLTDGYPIPEAVALPVQEVSPGPVQRPSGVCAATAPPSPTPTVTGPALGGGLPGTSNGPDGAALAATLVGALGLASMVWARRHAGRSEPSP